MEDLGTNDETRQLKQDEKSEDEQSEKDGYLRVVDESGEDYLYPQSYFILVHLPREAQDALQVSK